MNLYAFKPRGHGEYSFFVCSETEIEAKNAVEEYIKNEEDVIADGWGTEYYKLTTLKHNEVTVNAND
jgi:hypothetical protein